MLGEDAKEERTLADGHPAETMDKDDGITGMEGGEFGEVSREECAGH